MSASRLATILHELRVLQRELRLAATYKDKVNVTINGEKKTVYEYSDRQLSRRHNEKASRLEQLKSNLSELREKYRKHLTCEDPKQRLVALAVALIDETYERVGNETSAKERGHYGVTGWEKGHITWSGGKAVIKYVGKSGVKQEKVVENKQVLKALKSHLEGKDKSDCVFFYKDDDREFKVTAADVNAYLKEFDISAKDLRGLHANREMGERLKAIRKENGKLPTGQEEKKEQLTSEFERALEETAEAVGHEPATLRSNYLVPNMEDQFLKHGEVPTKWDE
jgi:DNA topoisomerase-1